MKKGKIYKVHDYPYEMCQKMNVLVDLQFPTDESRFCVERFKERELRKKKIMER